jgi:hypothetical protein
MAPDRERITHYDNANMRVHIATGFQKFNTTYDRRNANILE